jgi:P27 family predicted phage terminase small subunit
MSGPPPIPTRLKLLRGNPGHQKLNKNEPEPELSPDVPEPPTFLAAYAQDEWWRVAPELFRLKLLTILDVNTLAAYAQSYHRWRCAEEALAQMAERDPVNGGLLVRRASGDASTNPLVKIARDAADSMVDPSNLAFRATVFLKRTRKKRE